MSNEDFDVFFAKLQKELKEQEIEEFNEYIVNFFHNPKNWGKPPDEEITISQKYKGPCGDSMLFFLKIKGNIIEKANFITDGCGGSFATACQTTLLIDGKSLIFAEALKPEDINSALHGLPEDHKHCTELAIRTLRRAINKYKASKVK